MTKELATRKQAVGEFVREYRKRNPKYTHDYIKANGGPSGPAITRIERGEGARPHTLMALEQALDLPEGTLIRIVNGTNTGPPEDDVATALTHYSDAQLLAELHRRLVSRAGQGRGQDTIYPEAPRFRQADDGGVEKIERRMVWDRRQGR
jgi:hypothetical protein